jgi:hypothetical protein
MEAAGSSPLLSTPEITSVTRQGNEVRRLDARCGSLVFEIVWVFHWDAFPGISGALAGDGTIVAIQAAIMADLEVKGGVAKHLACLDADGAPDAFVLLDVVFPIGVLDKQALDGPGGAELIFGGGGQRRRVGLEVTKTEAAVTADRIRLHAFDRRGTQDTGSGAFFAVRALHGVDLPDGVPALGAEEGEASQETKDQGGQARDALFEEFQSA